MVTIRTGEVLDWRGHDRFKTAEIVLYYHFSGNADGTDSLVGIPAWRVIKKTSAVPVRKAACMERGSSFRGLFFLFPFKSF